MNLDPRFIRSQHKLHKAMLELASKHPLDKISVTAISDLAGVHRSTVYEHAESPAQLLKQAIHKELDELHEQHRIDGDIEITIEESSFQVLKYLESREAIFVRMGDEQGAEIREILRSHFIKSISLLIQNNKIKFPHTDVDISPEILKQITVFGIADMHVGIFAGMLQMPKPRSKEVIGELIRLTSPHWWEW